MKTSTLLELFNYCNNKTLFLAFNKSIQEEIQFKINQKGLKQAKAMTIHALGLSAIKNSFENFKINKNKNFDILKKLQSENKSIFKKYVWKDKIKITYTLIDINDISRLFFTNDIKVISEYFLNMDKVLFDFKHLNVLWEKFIKIRDSYNNKDKIEIDFIDMIYIPIAKNLIIPVKPIYLMIDEVQDLGLCQHKLVEKLINQGTIIKWIAIGDKNQSIYLFSGSLLSSFDFFKKKGNVKELSLDICYRCSKSIIESANEVYPVMKPYKDFEGKVERISNPELIKPDSMVICRNSSPLINLYFELLSLNKGCYIKGEDILNPIIRFLKPYKNTTVNVARSEMYDKFEKLSRDVTEKGRLNFYVFKENFDNFKLLSKHFCDYNDSIEMLISKLKTLFVNKNNSIMLCTIHKSKGLESDVVYILNEHLIPSKFAKSEQQLIQEKNLKYVARTRAKKELYFLDLKEQ